MDKKILSGGCSFTFGNELSDDDGKTPSKKSWASLIAKQNNCEYICVAKGGIGNQGIARKIFQYISNNDMHNTSVLIMWTFCSRYDWAMPRHKSLEETRWATITPWDTTINQKEVYEKLKDNKIVLDDWKKRIKSFQENNVITFADALYKYAANRYHETYLSWKSIIWIQNILEKKNISYMFTLADNTLFYDEFKLVSDNDELLTSLYKEIDFSKWFSFGERLMGFNQWAFLNGYEYATTHPLDRAHQDAVKLMQDKFKQTIKGE